PATAAGRAPPEAAGPDAPRGFPRPSRAGPRRAGNPRRRGRWGPGRPRSILRTPGWTPRPPNPPIRPRTPSRPRSPPAARQRDICYTRGFAPGGGLGGPMARRLTDGTDLVAVAKRQPELLWIILFGIGL